jgi:hypothetical protein
VFPLLLKLLLFPSRYSDYNQNKSKISVRFYRLAKTFSGRNALDYEIVSHDVKVLAVVSGKKGSSVIGEKDEKDELRRTVP